MRFKEIREYRDMDEATVAEVCAMTVARYESIESGKELPTQMEMSLLSRAFEIDASYLMGEENMANYVATVTVDYLYDGEMLSGYGGSEKIFIPMTISPVGKRFFAFGDSIYIADTNFENDGGYIVTSGDTDAMAVRENGVFRDADGNELTGEPKLHVIAETMTVASVVERTIDAVRRGETE